MGGPRWRRPRTSLPGRGKEPPSQAGPALPSPGLLPAAPSLGILCLAWIKCHASSNCFLGAGPSLLCLGTGLDKPENVADEQVSKCIHREAPPGPGRYWALTAVCRAVRRWPQAGVMCGQQRQMGAGSAGTARRRGVTSGPRTAAELNYACNVETQSSSAHLLQLMAGPVQISHWALMERGFFSGTRTLGSCL